MVIENKRVARICTWKHQSDYYYLPRLLRVNDRNSTVIHFLKEAIDMFVCLLACLFKAAIQVLRVSDLGEKTRENPKDKNQDPNPALVTHELGQIQTHHHSGTSLCGQN